jgi:hypothetical protein
MSGTIETKIDSIPREANAKINFFIHFTSYHLGRSARSSPSHYDAKRAKITAPIRNSLLRDTVLLLPSLDRERPK